jgi:hypothetical protein
VTYLDDLADTIRAEVPSSDVPNDDTRMLFRMYALLLLAKGANVDAEDVHNAWVAWMADRDDGHDALLPYADLPSDVAAEDQPYVNAIRAVARSRQKPVASPPLDTSTTRSDFHRLWRRSKPRPKSPMTDQDLFPTGPPGKRDKEGTAQLFELYKIMVASSEELVGRRQGVNTFFLTVNGALLTALGVVLTNGGVARLRATGFMVLTVAGASLAVSWRSRIKSYGQLNTGKFEVINRIETLFPAAIFRAEWKALGEGKDPRLYRSFTERETWPPVIFLTIYVIATVASALVAVGAWKL